MEAVKDDRVYGCMSVQSVALHNRLSPAPKPFCWLGSSEVQNLLRAYPLGTAGPADLGEDLGCVGSLRIAVPVL
jgi:hypothetical protein